MGRPPPSLIITPSGSFYKRTTDELVNPCSDGCINVQVLNISIEADVFFFEGRPVNRCSPVQSCFAS